MQTKLSVLLLILFLSLPCFAQQPRIDSIAVDEDNGKLALYGNFPDPWFSVVQVDSAQLILREASDTLLRALIPDRGKGSAGVVSVTTNSIESNKRSLTCIHILVTHCMAFDTFSTVFDNRVFDTIHVRGDFAGLQNPKTFISTKASQSYDNGAQMLRATLIYNTYDGKLIYLSSHDFGTGHNVAPISLDNTFTPIAGYVNSDHCGILNVEGFFWEALAPTDFPPSLAGVRETIISSVLAQARLSSDPVLSHAEIIFTLQNPKNVGIQILDILGHIISSDERILQAGENKLPINASALPSGIYICRLKAGGEVVPVRFVKE